MYKFNRQGENIEKGGSEPDENKDKAERDSTIFSLNTEEQAKRKPDSLEGGESIRQETPILPFRPKGNQAETLEQRFYRSKAKELDLEYQGGIEKLQERLEQIKRLLQSRKSNIPASKVLEFEEMIAKDEILIRSGIAIIESYYSLPDSAKHTFAAQVSGREGFIEFLSVVGELMDLQQSVVEDTQPSGNS